jgi:hypothetical protein
MNDDRKRDLLILLESYQEIGPPSPEFEFANIGLPPVIHRGLYTIAVARGLLEEFEVEEILDKIARETMIEAEQQPLTRPVLEEDLRSLTINPSEKGSDEQSSTPSDTFH